MSDDIDKEISESAMLDCQHQLIARVVLAGWRFDSMTSTRRVNAGYRDGKWRRGDLVSYTEWRMIRDDGMEISTEWAEDKYGAACAAFKLMQDYEPQDTSLPEGAFELRDDNVEHGPDRPTTLTNKFNSDMDKVLYQTYACKLTEMPK